MNQPGHSVLPQPRIHAHPSMIRSITQFEVIELHFADGEVIILCRMGFILCYLLADPVPVHGVDGHRRCHQLAVDLCSLYKIKKYEEIFNVPSCLLVFLFLSIKVIFDHVTCLHLEFFNSLPLLEDFGVYLLVGSHNDFQNVLGIRSFEGAYPYQVALHHFQSTIKIKMQYLGLIQQQHLKVINYQQNFFS